MSYRATFLSAATRLSLPLARGCRSLASLLLLALLLLAGRPAAWAQAPAPAWQTQLSSAMSGNEWVETRAVTTDEAGNTYLVGTYRGRPAFGNLTLTPAAGQTGGIFVAKWEAATQQLAWALPLVSVGGQPLSSSPPSGSSTGRMSIAVQTQYARLYVGCGSTLLCLSDLGSTAVPLWQQAVPGGSIEAVAARENSVYVAGVFTQQLTVGGSTLSALGTTTDVFVAKYVDYGSSAAGSWARRAGGGEDDWVSGLAVSGTSVYVVGQSYSRTSKFGTTTLLNGDQDSYGSADGYVAKLTDQGATADFTWALAASSPASDDVRAVAVQGTSVYVAGTMFAVSPRQTLTGSFGGERVAYQGQETMLVARLTDQGATYRVDWISARQEFNEPQALAARGNSLYLTGTGDNPGFIGGLRFSHPVSAASYSSSHPSFFLAKLTDTGTAAQYEWVKTIDQDANGAAVAAGGPTPRVFVVGTTRPETDSQGKVTVSSKSFVYSLLDYPTDLATLDLYPNPARAVTTLRLPAVPDASAATLRWYTLLGQLARTQTVPLGFPETTVELSLQGLAAGTYLLRVEAGSQHLARKLAVE